MIDTLVQAKVQWWNGTSAWVRCPICEKIHRHGFSGNYEENHRCISYCGSNRYSNYEMRFPTGNDVGYEIHKQRALFVAGRADPDEYFLERESDDRLPSFTEDMKSRPKWTEATETVHTGVVTTKKITVAASDMVLGNIEGVRQYLESTLESDIFLRGVQAWNCSSNNPDSDDDKTGSGYSSQDKTNGKTALHLAACKRCPEMLELLLEKGADPNARDVTGRVPLVEAALWGCLENVQVLLKHGARKDVECMRNGRRLRAVDFARPLTANAEERYHRSGGEEVLCHNENTYQRDLDRKAIVLLLGGEAEQRHHSGSSLSGFTFTKSPTDETLQTLVAYFNVATRYKTIGVLFRGSQLLPVAAMSGWSHEEDETNNIQIGGKTWTDEVLRLCDFIGHNLAPDPRDQGQSGRYCACHAEKQLIAFFIHKHLFLPYELEEEDDTELRFSELTLNEQDGERHTQPKRKTLNPGALRNLERAKPPVSLKEAIILTSNPICGDCEHFVERTNDALDLHITVK